MSHQSTSLKYDGSQGSIAVFALEPQRRGYFEKPRNLELKAYADASSRGRLQSRVLITSKKLPIGWYSDRNSKLEEWCMAVARLCRKEAGYGG